MFIHYYKWGNWYTFDYAIYPLSFYGNYQPTINECQWLIPGTVNPND